jgi:hypothetical protein
MKDILNMNKLHIIAENYSTLRDSCNYLFCILLIRKQA